jgi:hypothetical protein
MYVIRFSHVSHTHDIGNPKWVDLGRGGPDLRRRVLQVPVGNRVPDAVQAVLRTLQCMTRQEASIVPARIQTPAG